MSVQCIRTDQDYEESFIFACEPITSLCKTNVFLTNVYIYHIGGWTKEVGSRAELRGTLVRAKAIVITLFKLNLLPPYLLRSQGEKLLKFKLCL